MPSSQPAQMRETPARSWPSLHRDFELTAEAALTPMQIIVDATRNAARVFSPNPQVGTIQAFGALVPVCCFEKKRAYWIGKAEMTAAK